jgi:DNA-binding transcriptional MerR regulator
MKDKCVPGTVLPYAETGGMFAMFRPLIQATDGLTLSQVCSITGLEASTVQNWVKRGFVESPVKKLYNRDKFIRLAILNYFKDVFSLEGIISLLKMADQDSTVYSAFCKLLSMAPVDPIRSETKLSDIVTRVVGTEDFDFGKTSKEQARRLLTILYTAHLSIVLKKEAERLLTEI